MGGAQKRVGKFPDADAGAAKREVYKPAAVPDDVLRLCVSVYSADSAADLPDPPDGSAAPEECEPGNGEAAQWGAGLPDGGKRAGCGRICGCRQDF